MATGDVGAYSIDGNWACISCVSTGKHGAAIRERVTLGYGRLLSERDIKDAMTQVKLESVPLHELEALWQDGMDPHCNVCGKSLHKMKK